MSFLLYFFFSSRRRHTRLQGDWSSDVCSSDLEQDIGDLPELRARAQQEEALGRQVAWHELSIGCAIHDYHWLQGRRLAKALQGLGPGAHELALADDVGEVRLQLAQEQVIGIEAALVRVEQIVRSPIGPECGAIRELAFDRRR